MMSLNARIAGGACTLLILTLFGCQKSAPPAPQTAQNSPASGANAGGAPGGGANSAPAGNPGRAPGGSPGGRPGGGGPGGGNGMGGGGMGVSEDTYFPDQETRKQLRGVTIDQVASLELTGPHLQGNADTPILISDPTLVSEFVRGLKNSSYKPLRPQGAPPAKKEDKITLTFKPGSPNAQPITLTFDPTNENDNFGAYFNIALTNLGKQQAQALRTLAQQPDAIKSIAAGKTETSVPAEVQQLSAVLKQCDEKQFDYRNPKAKALSLRITLATGKSERYTLIGDSKALPEALKKFL